jgi:hypothetical protein
LRSEFKFQFAADTAQSKGVGINLANYNRKLNSEWQVSALLRSRKRQIEI